MSVKTISTIVTSSYTLSPSYAGLSITTTGGVEPPASAANVVGATGLDIRYGATVITNGQIIGGAGGTDTNGTIDVVGTAVGGGVGLLAEGAFSLVNTGAIRGGAGAVGESAFAVADNGGVGGAGLQQDAGHSRNFFHITGGAGGAGGQAYFAGVGGAGGAGAIVGSGGSLTNYQNLTGGQGGQGGYDSPSFGHGGAGGAGGAGAYDGGWLLNVYSIVGGQGGAGAGGNSGSGGNGGAGGAGVILNGGTFIAEYAVFGGAGGAGAAGSGGRASGSGGIQGDAVTAVGGGWVENFGDFVGYDGVADKAGAGVLTLINYGLITGTHDSVLLRNAGDILEVAGGSSLVGPVVGGGAGLTLTSGADTITRLGGAGSLYGAAYASFSGFGRYAVAGGASLTLAGETNTLAAGKTLTVAGSAYLASYLYNGGLVTAVGAPAAASGTIGSIGLTALHLSGVDMDLAGPGAVVGGAGGQGGGNGDGSGGSMGVAGGAGGAGAMQAAGYARSSSTLRGGVGGVGGQGFGGYSSPGPGGVGGAGGVGLRLNGTFVNFGSLAGGVGGAGAYPIQFPGYPGRSADAGDGGAGGAGATVSGGVLNNHGVIQGGKGGAGGAAPHYGSGHGGASGAYGDGVDIADVGPVILQNQAGGTIHGRIGVYAASGPGAVVANGGLISGSLYSVEFTSIFDTLQVYSGAQFVGKAKGAGGTLELDQGSGTLSGLGGTGTLSGAVSLGFSGFGRYQFDAGAWTLAGGVNSPGSLVLTAGATLTVTDATTLQLQGGLIDAGVIAFASSTIDTDMRVLAAGVTLGGGGVVEMDGTKARVVGAKASSTLTNVDNTIIGTGSVGANLMTLINDAAGVIEATGVMTLRDAAGQSVTNAGLIEANATGKLALVSETINQGGGGTILAAGGLITLQGVDIVGGAVTTTGAGKINVDGGGAMLDGSTGTVANGGLLQVTAAQTLTLTGAIANTATGKLGLHKGTLLIAAAGVTLSGGGQVNLNDNAANVVVGASPTATLTNVDNRINGAGDIGDGTMTLVNQAGGQIIGNQGLSLTLDTGTNTILNAGVIENVGKGGTLVKSAIANTGTLKAVTAGTLTLAGAVTGTGIAQINGGVLYVQQAFAEAVAFTGSTGTLKLGDSQAFTGKVSGLSKTGTNSLDLADIAYSSTKAKASYSGTTASGTLTVTDGTHTAHITLLGNYTAATWTLSNDGHGGTKVVDPATGVASPASSSVPLTQAMASFQHGPPAHLAGVPAYRLPRVPIFHVRA